MIYAVYNTKNAHALVFVVRGLVIQLAVTVGDKAPEKGNSREYTIILAHVFRVCSSWSLGSCVQKLRFVATGFTFEAVVMQNSMLERNCGGRRLSSLWTESRDGGDQSQGRPFKNMCPVASFSNKP